MKGEGLTVWVTFTRPPRDGPVSKYDSVYGIARLELNNKRKRSDAPLLSEENIELSGYMPPLVLPFVTWKIHICYKENVSYHTSLKEHIENPGSPQRRLVRVCDGHFFHEHVVTASNHNASLNNCVKDNLGKNIQLKNFISIEDLPFDVRKSSLFMWIAFGMAFAASSVSIDDITVASILTSHTFFMERVVSRMLSNGDIRKAVDGIRDAIASMKGNVYQVLEHAHVSSTLDYCYGPAGVSAISHIMQRLWPTKEFLWHDVIISVLIRKGLHTFLKRQKGESHGFFVGAPLRSVCDIVGLDEHDITIVQRNILSGILIIREGQFIYPREMMECVECIKEMAGGFQDMRCYVHRGTSMKTPRFGNQVVACEKMESSSPVDAMKKVGYKSNVTVRNVHVLKPRHAMDLFRFMRDNMKGCKVNFTFDPSGCSPGIYYNWCMALACLALSFGEDHLVYHEDVPVARTSTSQIKFLKCSEKNVLRRSWVPEGEDPTRELDVTWIKSGIDFDDSADAKEGENIGKNSWIRSSSHGSNAYGVVQRMNGAGLSARMFFRNSHVSEVKTFADARELRKIHAIPSDILSMMDQRHGGFNVMGIYAPRGIGDFSGWDPHSLRKCLGMAKKRVYVHVPEGEFDPFVKLFTGDDTMDFDQRREQFLTSELLSRESLEEFREFDICLKKLLS
jgi:hypothetical protein